MLFRRATQLTASRMSIATRGGVTMSTMLVRAFSSQQYDTFNDNTPRKVVRYERPNGRFYNNTDNTNHRTRRKLNRASVNHSALNPRHDNNNNQPQKFESGDRSTHQVIDAIITDVGTVLTSRHAKYDIEFALRTATPEQLRAIGDSLTGKVYEVFSWTSGAQIVNKVLPALSEEKRFALVRELWGDMKQHQALHQKEKFGDNHDAFNESNVALEYAKGSHNCLFPQTILRHGDGETKKALASALTGHAMELALDEYGCFVVQAVLKYMPTHLRNAFVSELLSDPDKVAAAAMDKHANFPLQNVMESGSAEEVEMIGNALKGHMVKLANNRYGQFSVIKALQLLRKSQRDPLAAELLANAEDIVSTTRSEFGTFVIQHLMQFGMFSEQETIGLGLRGNFTKLTNNANGSFVAELAMKYLPPNERNYLATELVLSAEDVLRCSKDARGSFVIRAILERGIMSHRKLISQAYEGNVVDLACDHYGIFTLQHAFKTLHPDNSLALVQELASSGQLTRVICHERGMEFVRSVFVTGTYKARQTIADALDGQLMKVLSNARGCTCIFHVLKDLNADTREAWIKEVLSAPQEDVEFVWTSVVGGARVLEALRSSAATEEEAAALKIMVGVHAVQSPTNTATERGGQVYARRSSVQGADLSASPVDWKPASAAQTRGDSSGLVLNRLSMGELVDDADRDEAFELALSKTGSGLIQALIERAANSDTDIAGAILRVVQGRVGELAVNTYGVYVIESIFKLDGNGHDGCQRMRDMVATELLASKQNVMDCSMSKSGTFVIRQILQNGSAYEHGLLVEAFRGEMMELARHQFGQFVVKAASASLPNQLWMPLCNELLASEDSIVQLARDKYASIVISDVLKSKNEEHVAKVFEAFKSRVDDLARGYFSAFSVQEAFKALPENMRNELMDELIKSPMNVVRYAMDKSAGYVLQDVVARGTREHSETIASAFKGHMVELSMSQGGWHIVRDLLKRLPEFSDERVGMVMELLGEDGNNLVNLALDQHGSFLVKWMIQYGSLAEQTAVQETVHEHKDMLSKSRFGSWIVIAERDRHRGVAPRGSRGGGGEGTKHTRGSQQWERR